MLDIIPRPCSKSDYEVSDYVPDFYEEAKGVCQDYRYAQTKNITGSQCSRDNSLDSNLCYLQHHLRVTGYEETTFAMAWQLISVLIIVIVIAGSVFLWRSARNKKMPNKTLIDYIPFLFLFALFMVLLVFCLNNYFVEKNQASIARSQENALIFCRGALREYGPGNKNIDAQKVILSECLQAITKVPTSGFLNSVGIINTPVIPTH